MNDKIDNTFHIFDLDETIVDSSKRTPYKENGDLDLKKYRELQTHENILTDKLLPLFHVMKELIDEGANVGIITARRLTKSDYYMLRKNGIKTPYIGSRDQVHKVAHISKNAHLHYNMKDSEYKRVWFKDIKSRFPSFCFHMYDDNKTVLKAAQEEGFFAVDAIHLNKMMVGAI